MFHSSRLEIAMHAAREVAITPGAPPTFGDWLPQFFAASQIVGLLGMIFILLPVVLLRVQRHPTFVSFATSWFISALSYSLLTFAGQQLGPPPHFGLCLTQASLAYGAPPLTGLTTLALVLQLWLSLFSMSPSKTESRRGRNSFLVYGLLIGPWLVYCVIVVMAIAMGASQPQNVERAGSAVYCVITGPMGKISVGFVLISTVVIVGFEIFITISFYRAWKRHSSTGASASMLLRVLVFSGWSILTVGASVVFVTAVFTPLPNIFIALTPVMASIIFGTQMDILRSYKFWGPRLQADSAATSRLSSSSISKA